MMYSIFDESSLTPGHTLLWAILLRLGLTSLYSPRL